MTTKIKVRGIKTASTGDDAMSRVMNNAAIDLADLAVLMGVHVSTLQRAANNNDLPVPIARVGQRWIIPSAPVRQLLHLNEVA